MWNPRTAREEPEPVGRRDGEKYRCPGCTVEDSYVLQNGIAHCYSCGMNFTPARQDRIVYTPTQADRERWATYRDAVQRGYFNEGVLIDHKAGVAAAPLPSWQKVIFDVYMPFFKECATA